MNSNHDHHNGFHLARIDSAPKKNNVFDEEFGFYSEEHFHSMLAMERKRTERSAKPILLVTLNIAEILASFPRKKVIKDISTVVVASARDIDTKGWFESQTVIGIIYTEITNSGKEPILTKIHNNLERELGLENAEKVAVAFASFPQENNGRVLEVAGLPETCFYPSPHKHGIAKRVSLSMKRVVDVVGSLVLILLFSPIFIIVSILVKFTSRGPVLFSQTRIGKGGKEFTFYKFRSMRVGNDNSVHKEYVKKLIQGGPDNGGLGNGGVFKIKNDPRVTLVGRFIRKTSLDELPQFFNVLIGDMSLVGPRPPIPYELENYRVWHKRRVLEAKPGITGFWQVSGRSSTTFDTMVRMDLQYIQQRTLLGDIKLIMQTPLALFKGGY